MKLLRNLTLVLACTCALAVATGGVGISAAQAQRIQHDAEHYILLRQHGKRWAAEDKELDKKLAEIRKRNGGKRPNIVYILLDDVGFGEFGIPALNLIRGSKTPKINEIAREGLSFVRMYTEPICTPTRAAFMTGRLALRSGMHVTKVTPPEGVGLPGSEVTIAELLSKVGYQTMHVGKWHLGDIKESYPTSQGFDWASFAMHNQVAFGFLTHEAELIGITSAFTKKALDKKYALDKTFRLYGWALSVEGSKGGPLREWGIKPGEEPTYDYYRKINKRYQAQALQSLRSMAKKGKPFFLNYWPMIPVAIIRERKEFLTSNGGLAADAMAIVDEYIGEIVAEIKKLGIEKNTLVVVMGDNGAFKQNMPENGWSDWIFRGVKGQVLEGGVRVGAVAWWPGVIKPGSLAGDIIHVTDLYTTFARIAGATKHIPTDRIVDGVDQLPIFLKGDGNGRRDYVHLYEMDQLKATVKQQMKIHWPPPSVNPAMAKVFNLYWDPREEHPLKSAGVWTGTPFVRMRVQHLGMMKKFPHRQSARGMPYEGVVNLRPETKKMVKTWLDTYGDARNTVLGVEGMGN